MDAIFEDADGQLTAIQAKFRQDRHASIPWSELSTFFGCTEQANHRLVVTNVTRLPKLVAKRQHFSAILVDELDALPASFFTSLKEYLATRCVVYPAPKQPWPFQQEIINQAVHHYQQTGQPRGRLIMACGTGKTLTALWIAEGLGVREALVLVPSLTLMRQTLREWATNTAVPPLDCICICSDVTVAPSSSDPDPAIQRLWEMGVPVSTEPRDLLDFLTRPAKGGMRVVLSTYQSGDVLEAALSQLSGFRFDLAICDEAHRTAGPLGRPFAKVLRDDAIPSARRLFMTATPRSVAPSLQRRADAEDIVLCSMDDEATYGPVISSLPFGKAIELGVIADYRIALVGVRDPEVQRLLEENPPLGIAGPEGRAVRAQHLAKQLAVLKGMTECDARKVFTFHGRIRAAKAFALASTPEGIQHLLNRLPAYRGRLTAFRADHVNGTQSTADRAPILKETLAAPFGLVSNAGCLTEGVDIPAVDGVAFIDPRESLSAIVQATGRALRKSEGKTCGYVLIPVFLGETDDPDQIAESGQFKTVYRVVRAMADQDERLEERLRLARREMALGGSGPADSGPIVTIGIKTSYADFDRAIYLRIVERTAPNWEKMFVLLEAYKAEHGHLAIPQDAVFQGAPLGRWVKAQRQFKKRGRLSSDRVERLEALGIVWEPFNALWEEMHTLLAAYKAERGHVQVPVDEEFRGKPLGKWLTRQRHLRGQGRLSHNRVLALEALGVEWEPIDAQWESMYSLLESYRDEHGHIGVPPDEIFREKPLGSWLNTQRQFKKKGRLSAERFRRLEALGIKWDPRDALHWEEMYAIAKAYAGEHGHVHVPRGEVVQGEPLGAWLTKQRHLRKLGKLSSERIQRLEALGVDWDSKEARWCKMADLLEAYKSDHGHVRPLQSEKFRGAPLGKWLVHQRQLKKLGKLSSERIQRLEALGVDWDFKEAQWNEMYRLLEAYKAEHGHVQVLQAEIYRGKALGRWIDTQRQLKSRNKLSPEHLRDLQALGVEWGLIDTRWEEMFSILEAYRAENGHVRVPQDATFQNKPLGSWLSTQRQLKRKGKLSQERSQRLEALGIDWEPRGAQWERTFNLLVAYKEEHGHVQLRQNEIFPGKQLGRWLHKQRQLKKLGKLSAERIRRLDALGIDWTPKRAN